MRVVMIADAFPPMRTSGAVQMRDLSLEFVRQGHEVTVMIPGPELNEPWTIDVLSGVQVIRLKAPVTKDIGYVRRVLGEFLMPFAMMRNLNRSPLAGQRWDGVVWYAPSIFFGPIVKSLKHASACRSYLIVRDIFPEWAVEMGLMGRGLPYRFFKMIEKFQYSVADVVGVQTHGNIAYLDGLSPATGPRVEVLQNWLSDAPNVGSTICIDNTKLAGRKIFVYAGNMGVAQGMGILLKLAESLRSRHDIGFLFVGRGSDAHRLRTDAASMGLTNVVFFDEIDPTEIPGLYAQCHVGIVALDPRHKTHNIPGKFLSYMQAGLPVLASINPGNDLIDIISDENVGKVCTDQSVKSLADAVFELVSLIDNDKSLHERCKALFSKRFSPTFTVQQIVAALN